MSRERTTRDWHAALYTYVSDSLRGPLPGHLGGLGSVPGAADRGRLAVPSAPRDYAGGRGVPRVVADPRPRRLPETGWLVIGGYYLLSLVMVLTGFADHAVLRRCLQPTPGSGASGSSAARVLGL